MRTLALIVEYDGTDYCGFQRQSGVPSVASELERALALLLGHAVKLVAAGRTDAGVHATGQVVSFATTSEFPIKRLPVAASALLRERRIAVLRAAERAAGFSARFDALARSYRYRILNRTAPSPLERLRVFHVSAGLDLDAMRAAAALLEGTHDFAAFSALAPGNGHAVRTISNLSIAAADEHVELDVTADSFLHHMVRIVVGTLVEVARGKRTPADVAETLDSRQRERAGFTAPPHGLYLTKVHYAEPIEAASTLTQ